MSTPQKKHNSSPETRHQAMKVARSNQRPGQTKEQTRLIAQGIQKGIEQYKKQQKIKARELDKKIKKVNAQIKSPNTAPNIETREIIKYRQHWLPWSLLAISWIAMVAYQLVN